MSSWRVDGEIGSGPGSTWCGGNEQGERRQKGEGKGQGRWGGRVGPVCMLFDLTAVHVVWFGIKNGCLPYVPVPVVMLLVRRLLQLLPLGLWCMVVATPPSGHSCAGNLCNTVGAAMRYGEGVSD